MGASTSSQAKEEGIVVVSAGREQPEKLEDPIDVAELAPLQGTQKPGSGSANDQFWPLLGQVPAAKQAAETFSDDLKPILSAYQAWNRDQCTAFASSQEAALKEIERVERVAAKAVSHVKEVHYSAVAVASSFCKVAQIQEEITALCAQLTELSDLYNTLKEGSVAGGEAVQLLLLC